MAMCVMLSEGIDHLDLIWSCEVQVLFCRDGLLLALYMVLIRLHLYFLLILVVQTIILGNRLKCHLCTECYRCQNKAVYIIQVCNKIIVVI